MKSRIIIFLSLGLIAIFSFTLMNKTGKAGYAGSPGEASCSNCHNSFPLNSGPGSLKIRTNIPNDLYVPDSVYEISVVVEQSGRSLFGFGLEALQTGNTNAGTFIVTDAARTQQLNATNGRKNMTHKLNGGAFADSSVFTFNWQAPSTNVGNITFYFTGVAANGNNANSLDYVYRSNHVISSTSTLGINESPLVSGFNIKPFQGGISIDLFLQEDVDVLIRLVALDGKLVTSRMMQNQIAGNQNYLLTTSNILTGIYIVQIQVKDINLSRKVFINA